MLQPVALSDELDAQGTLSAFRSVADVAGSGLATRRASNIAPQVSVQILGLSAVSIPLHPPEIR